MQQAVSHAYGPHTYGCRGGTLLSEARRVKQFVAVVVHLWSNITVKKVKVLFLVFCQLLLAYHLIIHDNTLLNRNRGAQRLQDHIGPRGV